MRKILFQAFLFCVANTSLAQVVNIEAKRFKTDTIGWKGSADLGFSMGKQKETFFMMSANAHVQYKSKKHLYLLLGNSDLVKSKTAKLINSGFIHFRHNFKLKKDWVRWESFTQAQFNKMNGLKVRYLLGTGPRFKILSKEDYRIYIGTLYMYEFEKSLDGLTKLNQVRFSSYLSYTFCPIDILELIGTFYYQPNITENKDYRLSSENSINVKLHKNLILGLNFRMNYDSFPPSGAITKLTYLWNNSIKVVF